MSDKYKDAGVDLDAHAGLIGDIKEISQKTLMPWVISGVGGFSGLIDLKKLNELALHFQEPVLTLTTDGVGTKTQIAKMIKMRPDLIKVCGEDIVNHCINDTIPCGATPIAFLDYIAQDKLRPEEAVRVLEGMASACKRAAISLVGGETAQMGTVYGEGEIDIAGCMLGIVDKKDMIDGSDIRPYDCLIGLASNGLHTNGYSLAQDVLSNGASPGSEQYWPYFHHRELGGIEPYKLLLRPHTSYLRPIMRLRDMGIKIRGIAHITGGGIAGNLVRILPKETRAKIKKSTWSVPPIFELIQKSGNISEEEMFEVFNMGIGMILVVPSGQCNLAMYYLEEKIGCEAYEIGRIEKGDKPAFAQEGYGEAKEVIIE